MKIGLLGVGVVGSALRNYFSEKPENKLKLYDPYRGYNDDLSDCDVAFISVPVATKEDRSQDLTQVEHCLEKLQKLPFFGKPIFLKSTVLPETTDYLARLFLLKLYHMPEFLTERFANEDMAKQDIICGGREDMSFGHMNVVKELFWNKKILFMRNIEAELAKYAHNCFAAMKVNYFNMIKHTSDILGAEYQTVLNAAMISGFIEQTHTQVPGPDGKCGYGGKCLPKDLKAFIGFLDKEKIKCHSLLHTELENQFYRKQS